MRRVGPILIGAALGSCWLAGCGAGGENAAQLDAAPTIVEAVTVEMQRLWQAAQETDENFPGGVAAFALPDGRVFSVAVGFEDVEAGKPMTTNRRLPSGSIGKSYVAATALALAQQGRLDLDAPIATWVGKEDWFERVPNGPDLTLRILLSHTGGLIDHAFDSEDFVEALVEIAGDSDAYLTPRQLLEFALDRDPLFAAGEGYNYTDTGYVLAGLVIEAATGRLYNDLLREQLLEPHGFEFAMPADRRDLPDVAQGYAHASSELFGVALETVDEDGWLKFHPSTEWTGGGMLNNPADLVRWAQLLYQGRAFEGDYVDELLRPGWIDPDQPDESYGLGVSLRRSDRHGPMVGHGGFYPGYNSMLAYFPDHEVAVAMQINSDASNCSEHTVALAELILDQLLGASLK